MLTRVSLEDIIFNFKYHSIVAVIALFITSGSNLVFCIYVVYWIFTVCHIFAKQYEFSFISVVKFLKESFKEDLITWENTLLYCFAILCSISFFTEVYITFNVPVTNWLSFPLPENQTLSNIILLYTEILFIGVVILIVILDTIATILLHFKAMPESHLFNAAMLDYKLRTNGLGRDYTLDSYLEEQVEISNYEPYEYTVQTEELFDFIFAIFPTIVILLILVPALGFLYTEEFFLDFIFYDISINVIAAQWYWTYEIKLQYLFNIEIFTARSYRMNYIEVHTFLVNEYDASRLWETEFSINLPSNVNIFVSVTSADVVHSWSLPGYGSKTDAIPGRVSSVVIESNHIGFIWGQCSELCGVYHGFMPISVSWNDGRFFWNIYIYKGDTTNYIYRMTGPFKFVQTVFGYEPRNYQSDYNWSEIEKSGPEGKARYDLHKKCEEMDRQKWKDEIKKNRASLKDPFAGPVPGTRYYDYSQIPQKRYRIHWDQEQIDNHFGRQAKNVIEFYMENLDDRRCDWSEQEKRAIREVDATICRLEGMEFFILMVGLTANMLLLHFFFCTIINSF